MENIFSISCIVGSQGNDKRDVCRISTSEDPGRPHIHKLHTLRWLLSKIQRSGDFTLVCYCRKWRRCFSNYNDQSEVGRLVYIRVISLGNFRLLPSCPHITHKTEKWILKEHLKCKIWSAKCDVWNVKVDRKYKIPCVELCASRHTLSFFFFAVLFDCLFVLFLSFSVSVSRLWISKHSKLHFIIVLLAMDRNIDRLVLESFTTTKWTTFRLQGEKTRSVFYHQNQIWSYQGKDLNPPPHPVYLWIKAEWHVWFLVRLVERK